MLQSADQQIMSDGGEILHQEALERNSEQSLGKLVKSSSFKLQSIVRTISSTISELQFGTNNKMESKSHASCLDKAMIEFNR